MVAVIITIIITLIFGGSIASGKQNRLWSQICGFGHYSRLNSVVTEFLPFLEPQNVTFFGNRVIEDVIS